MTGTPGVGKTAISKILTEKLDALYINLADVVKTEKFILNEDTKRNTLVADLPKLSDKINHIIKNTFRDIVVDGHYAAYVVPSAIVTHVFVLRIDPDILIERLKARGYDEKKILENVAAEILDVCLVEAIKKYSIERVDEIDVTKKIVEDIVNDILSVITGQRRHNVGVVDWLGRLTEDGRLERIITILDKELTKISPVV